MDVGQAEVGVSFNDLARGHAQVFVLGGDLGDLEVVTRQHGSRSAVVDVREDRARRLHDFDGMAATPCPRKGRCTPRLPKLTEPVRIPDESNESRLRMPAEAADASRSARAPVMSARAASPEPLTSMLRARRESTRASELVA